MTTEAACQRSLDRKRVLMNATIISAEGSQPARVNELTGLGARIFCDREMAPDSEVIFKRGDTFAAARVAWSDESGTGLEFYRPLPSARLAA